MDPSYLSLDAFSSSLSSSLFLGDGANSQSSLGDYFNFEFTSATFSEIEAISSQKKASSPSPSSPSSVTTTTPKDTKKLINGNASRTRTRNATGISTSKNAARERSRVKSLRSAFQNLQKSLPYVPPNTKLSKLDVLILATTYISHLMKLLGQGDATEDKEPCASAASYSAHNDKIPGCQDENGKLPSLFQHSPPIDIHAAPLQMESNGPSFRSRLWEANYLHPVKKWPMRSRLYAGVEDDCQLPQSLQFGNRKQLCNDTYSSMLANIAGGNQDIFQ